MTEPARFVDTSSFQGQIDFVANCAWARQWDGIARIAMKATEGTGFVDPLFRDNRDRALAAGFDCIYCYHFSRPDLGNSPSDEANFMRFTVGNVRDSDRIMLDYEVSSPYATSDWAYGFLVQQEANYSGKLPGLYASSAYIQERLGHDTRLARYPLWLANWQYTPDERPPVPAPWTSYEFVQYSDKAIIPGVPGTVDADIFLGGNSLMSNISTVPQGWTDDGSTLKSPNGIPVVLGFRDHVMDPRNNWDPDNWALEAEQHLTGLEQSNPSLGDGQSQIFRWKRLEYTAKMGVFEGWLGQELLSYQKEVAQLESQITALKTLPGVGNLKTINDLVAQASTAIAQAGITIAKIGPLSQVQ